MGAAGDVELHCWVCGIGYKDADVIPMPVLDAFGAECRRQWSIEMARAELSGLATPTVRRWAQRQRELLAAGQRRRCDELGVMDPSTHRRLLVSGSWPEPGTFEQLPSNF